MRISEYDPDTHERATAFVAGAYYDHQADLAEQFEGAMTVDEDAVEGSVTGTYVRFAPVGTDPGYEMIESQYNFHVVRPEGSDAAQDLAEKYGFYESDMDYDALAAAWNESRK